LPNDICKSLKFDSVIEVIDKSCQKVASDNKDVTGKAIYCKTAAEPPTVKDPVENMDSAIKTTSDAIQFMLKEKNQIMKKVE